MTTVEIFNRAKKMKAALSFFSSEEKNKALLAMADALIEEKEAILEANEKDVAAARGTVSDVMIDRLQLSPARIEGMANGIRDVVTLPDPVGKVLTYSASSYIKSTQSDSGTLGELVRALNNYGAAAAAYAAREEISK